MRNRDQLRKRERAIAFAAATLIMACSIPEAVGAMEGPVRADGGREAAAAAAPISNSRMALFRRWGKSPAREARRRGPDQTPSQPVSAGETSLDPALIAPLEMPLGRRPQRLLPILV
jgi:hypothetical protein